MSSFRLTLALALAGALAAAPALAQETAPEGQTPGGEAPAAPAEGSPGPESGGLSMGEPVAPDGGQIGTPYVKEEHGDWDIRCIRTPSGNDPCQLYQLLKDADGNSVAEIALFPLVPPQDQAVAGGNIISPLETLLPAGVTMQIDSGEPRRYPFTFCTETGCFARIGYTEADVNRFKRGAKATVTIVPVLAPDQRIQLPVSLTGFTAGYDRLAALINEQVEAARQAGEAPAAEAAPEAGGN
ncbi:MAG: invasion associated locus B family protein [Rhodobacteraceae bacterium]|nr:invasion associated locus B family protein [Paracoccaceae bacterium]